MKYIIDTDIMIYFLKNHPKVVSKFEKTDQDDIATTIVNYTELLFGAYNSLKIKENLSKVKSFLKTIAIADFDKSSAEVFARLKADLRKSGKIIADMDLMIAGICIANNLILVTNNSKHFERISGLKKENWSI